MQRHFVFVCSEYAVDARFGAPNLLHGFWLAKDRYGMPPFCDGIGYIMPAAAACSLQPAAIVMEEQYLAV